MREMMRRFTEKAPYDCHACHDCRKSFVWPLSSQLRLRDACHDPLLTLRGETGQEAARPIQPEAA